MTKAVNTGNGHPSGMKNRIINGGMDISQRGTSFTPSQTGAAVYTLDRWSQQGSNDGAVTVTKNSDVPASNEFQNSLRVAVTTADASIATGQYAFVSQPIEGYNVRDLIGRTFTVSFWVRSSKTGTHCLALQNSTADRSYISEYTITAADTWQYKTISIIGGLTAAGTWNYTNGTGLYVLFSIACGATYQTTASAWNTGGFLGTVNQVNCLDTIGNIFAITGVQLELGPVATPFEHRLYSAELALCQRYFYVYCSTAVDFQEPLNRYSTTAGIFTIRTPVTMRNTPTLYLTGSNPFFRGVFYDTSFINTQSNITAISINSVPTFDHIDILCTHGAVAGTNVYSSIDNLGVTGVVGLSAEL